MNKNSFLVLDADEYNKMIFNVDKIIMVTRQEKGVKIILDNNITITAGGVSFEEFRKKLLELVNEQKRDN